MRVTYGQTSRSGVIPLSDSFDVTGAIANTVEQIMIKNGVDALIYPTMSRVASVRHDAKDSTYKCDSDDPYAASYLASSAHLPEISVPAGRDSQNMPIGLSFTGTQDSERILLGLAAAYENISPYKNGDGLELDRFERTKRVCLTIEANPLSVFTLMG